MTRKDLPEILYQLIKELGGSADMMTIFRKFWKDHRNEIQEDDDFFILGIMIFGGLQPN